MKYRVDITDEAKQDFRTLDKNSQKKIARCFEWIEEYDLNFVYTKPIGANLFEIKQDDIRALYGYKDNQIIVVAVIFLKKTQKCPKIYIEKAKRILEREL